jgi:putative transposase
VTHRNGYRARPWETRVGEIELLIPRARQGSDFPSFLEPRRRSEQAVVVLEAYVNGVPTRPIAGPGQHHSGAKNSVSRTRPR